MPPLRDLERAWPRRRSPWWRCFLPRKVASAVILLITLLDSLDISGAGLAQILTSASVAALSATGLLQSQDTVPGGTVATPPAENGAFPGGLYREWLQLQFSRPGESQRLLRRLFEALQNCANADSRCELALGNMYFQGIAPPSDPKKKGGKNLTLAIDLWHSAAARGNGEAQFTLGVFLSSFVNPPRYFSSPAQVLQDLEGGSAFASVPFGGRNESAASPRLSPLAAIEKLRFVMSLQVLDLQDSARASSDKSRQRTLRIESRLVNRLIEHLVIADQLPPANSPLWKNPQGRRQTAATREVHLDKGVEAAAGSRAGEITPLATDSDALLGALDFNQIRRFPLQQHDSLAMLHYYLAAQGRHIGALLAMGFRHFYGIGVPAKCSTAAAYYVQVASLVAELSSQGIPPAAEAIRLDLNGLAAGRSDSADGSSIMGAGSLKSHYQDLQLHVAQAGDPRIQMAVGRKHLFGLDSFPQDFKKALYYFRLSASQDHRDAIAYLGYLYALGLGVDAVDTDTAFDLFSYAAASPDDVIAHNGLGYLLFSGTSKAGRNIDLALYHFNLSAARGFPDAQYNLAALYLTGAGVTQSYTQAIVWLTRALEQGHTSAAYLLGVMHLNGLGSIRDCSVATSLFKRVAEKHPWVAINLHKALQLQRHKRLDEAVFIYWMLAEAGHEIAQINLGQLLDGGGLRLAKYTRPEGFLDTLLYRFGTWLDMFGNALFTPTALFSLDKVPSIGVNRFFAQRYWTLAAAQNLNLARSRLGDYAYYGWGGEQLQLPSETGLSLEDIDFLLATDSSVGYSSSHLLDSEGKSMAGWARARPRNPIIFRRLTPNYELAFGNFLRSTEIIPTSRISVSHMAKAEFNLGYMYQMGYGVEQDFYLARRHYRRLALLDPQAWLPMKLVIVALQWNSLIAYWKRVPFTVLIASDFRLKLLVVQACIFVAAGAVRLLTTAAEIAPQARSRISVAGPSVTTSTEAS